MPDGVPPFAIYVPGVDSDQNGSRSQAVRAVTIHTTQGNDSRGLGSGRHHNTPGTFNFLNRDDGLYCYYPAHVRCSHAAGANNAGPGIENEGFTGSPLTANQISNLGALATWLAYSYGIPLTYRTGDPREWIDRTGFSGFIAHRAVDYPPDTSLRHTDEITPDEWARAIGSPTPQTPEGSTMKVVAFNVPGTGVLTYLVDGFLVKQFPSTPAGPFGISQEGAAFAASAGLGPVAVLGKDELDKYAANAPGAVRTFLAKLFPAKAARAGA